MSDSEERVRVNISIKRAHHRKAKELIARVDGLTFSGMLDELLGDALPMLEALLDEADRQPTFWDDEQAQDRVLSQALARQIVQKIFGSQERFIHTLAQMGGLEKSAA